MVTRRSAADQAARKERLAAIRQCRRCDPCGWKLGPDGTPIDPAVRCTHSSPPAPPSASDGRDFTEPIHEFDLFSEPIHQPEDESASS